MVIVTTDIVTSYMNNDIATRSSTLVPMSKN